jgi:hypothetical protein
MFPDVETMIADIVRWIPEGETIIIKWDPNPGYFALTIAGEPWQSEDLEGILHWAWEHWNTARNLKPEK